ncbi:MAG: hypothetical protein ACI84O_001137 [Myxococcota bacterium]|jgi:hypothetical protein
MNKLAPVIALVVLCAFVFVLFSDDENRSIDLDMPQATVEGAAPATIEESDVAAAPVIDRALASSDAQPSVSNQQGLEHVIGEAAFVTFTVVDADGALLSECLVSPESKTRAQRQGLFAESPADDREDYILNSDANIVLAVSSNREAYFSIHHPQWQEYIFTCQAPASGEVRDLGKIVLNPAATISGIISDEQGHPISNATVGAISTNNSFSMEVLKASTTSDEQGSFVLGGLQADEYQILAQAPSFSSASTSVSIKTVPVAETIAIQLEGGATISGRVLATDGTPIANADILQVLESNSMRFMAEDPVIKGETIATTDNSGNYSAAVGMSDGVAHIGARHPNYKDTKIEVTENHSMANITMQPSLHLYGSFANASGLQIKSTSMRLTKKVAGDNSQELYFSRINALEGEIETDGSFKFNDIAAGIYTLSADTNLGVVEVDSLSIDVSIDDYILGLPLIPRLNFHVVDAAGQPIENVYLNLGSQEQKGSRSRSGDLFTTGDFTLGGSISHSARTNEDGDCVVGGMPQGKYSLSTTHPDYAATVKQMDVWQDSEDIEIVLTPAALLTVNTLNPAQQAVADIRIKLMQGDKRVAETTTNDFGAASFPGLSGGEYLLLFDAEQSSSGGMVVFTGTPSSSVPPQEERGKLGRTTVQLIPGEHQSVDWQIAGLCDLTVLVRKNGRPIEGIVVSVKQDIESQSNMMFFNAFGEEDNTAMHTDSQGIAVISNQPIGEYTLELKANKNSFATEQKISLYEGANNISVDLSVNDVSGVLVDSSGNAIADGVLSLVKAKTDDDTTTGSFSISIGDGNGNEFRNFGTGEGLVTTTSDASGHFIFTDIPDGDWQIVARQSGFVPAKSERFSLSSGMSLDIGFIEFEISGSISGLNRRHTPLEAGDGFSRRRNDNFMRLSQIDENGETIGEDHHTSSDGDLGEFSFGQLSAGDYILRCGNFKSEPMRLSRGEDLKFNIPADE